MLASILKILIPGDDDLGMPSVDSKEFFLFCQQNATSYIIDNLIEKVSLTSAEIFTQEFRLLTIQNQIEVVELCKKKSIRIYSDFVVQLLKFYYSRESVLSKIGSGSIPPFPNGNFIDVDNWDILEEVYLRGPIYRKVEE